MTSIAPTAPTTPPATQGFGGLKLVTHEGFMPDPRTDSVEIESNFDFIAKTATQRTPERISSGGAFDAAHGAKLVQALKAFVEAGEPATAPGPQPTDGPSNTLKFTLNGKDFRAVTGYPSKELREVFTAISEGVETGGTYAQG